MKRQTQQDTRNQQTKITAYTQPLTMPNSNPLPGQPVSRTDANSTAPARNAPPTVQTQAPPRRNSTQAPQQRSNVKPTRSQPPAKASTAINEAANATPGTKLKGNIKQSRPQLQAQTSATINEAAAATVAPKPARRMPHSEPAALEKAERNSKTTALTYPATVQTSNDTVVGFYALFDDSCRPDMPDPELPRDEHGNLLQLQDTSKMAEWLAITMVPEEFTLRVHVLLEDRFVLWLYQHRPISVTEFHKYWPGDFDSTGMVLHGRQNRGLPGIGLDDEGQWRFVIVNGKYRLYGGQGLVDDIGLGNLNMLYDMSQESPPWILSGADTRDDNQDCSIFLHLDISSTVDWLSLDWPTYVDRECMDSTHFEHLLQSANVPAVVAALKSAGATTMKTRRNRRVVPPLYQECDSAQDTSTPSSMNPVFSFVLPSTLSAPAAKFQNAVDYTILRQTMTERKENPTTVIKDDISRTSKSRSTAIVPQINLTSAVPRKRSDADSSVNKHKRVHFSPVGSEEEEEPIPAVVEGEETDSEAVDITPTSAQKDKRASGSMLANDRVSPSPDEHGWVIDGLSKSTYDLLEPMARKLEADRHQMATMQNEYDELDTQYEAAKNAVKKALAKNTRMSDQVRQTDRVVRQWAEANIRSLDLQVSKDLSRQNSRI